MEICCFPQSISTYFYKFQSISIILSPYLPYLLIPLLTLLMYNLNGYRICYLNNKWEPSWEQKLTDTASILLSSAVIPAVWCRALLLASIGSPLPLS
ncbi:MAG: hypothetical protein AB1422_12040 [bacterium]